MNAPPVSRPASGRRPSLTRQLLLWSLGALAFVWGRFVFFGYQTGVLEADVLTDGHLASVAALLQVAAQTTGHARIVFDHEYSHAGIVAAHQTGE